ncbi:hypothetical protein ACCO45_000136 [Purpureocillium lilacinum]|uniref:Uncharacterized protein n=1 Tax=Purpureocillium lilacinum TaxID=33203 RepID=A0ACC4E4C2_PURLI
MWQSPGRGWGGDAGAMDNLAPAMVVHVYCTIKSLLRIMGHPKLCKPFFLRHTQDSSRQTSCLVPLHPSMTSKTPSMKRFLVPSMNTSGHGNGSGNLSGNTTQITASFGLFSKQTIVEQPRTTGSIMSPALVATGVAAAIAGYAATSAIARDSKNQSVQGSFHHSDHKLEARKIAEEVMGLSDAPHHKPDAMYSGSGRPA